MILNELLSLVFDFSVTETTDDVTCILLRYDQPATPEIAQPREGVIQEELQEFPVTADLLERGRAMTTEQLTRAQLPEDFVIECTYGVHEALANIWVHVFKGKPAPSQRVTLHLRAHADWWYASIRYRGSAFRTDPSRELDTTAFQENGYGMAIIHSVMDSVVLCQGTDTRMKLIMAKRLPT
jgi:anti-sigma regulatory factor (Ser/Thr protein kinase)